MKTLLLLVLASTMSPLVADVAPAAADGMLRAAQTQERAGRMAAAAADYERVYRSPRLPSFQRLAALCGLLRTDTRRVGEWVKTGLTAKDEVWSGTTAQAAALLPEAALANVRANWLDALPPDARQKLLRALVHVKSPAARAFLADAIAQSKSPSLRHEALEGLGRTGSVADVETLLMWVQSDDADGAAAARRGLISLVGVAVDAALSDRLAAAADSPGLLVKLLDVLTVRNALGFAAKIVPCLSSPDAAVRTQAYKALGLQGGAAEQAAVLAAAMKTVDANERKEARKAVMKIARRAGGVQFKARRIGNCRTEACGVADFNNDGKPDVIAGPYLYLAPEFRPVKVREVASDVTDDGKGYARDFMNLPLDVNGDGRCDVVSGDWFSKETWWIENLLPAEGIWPQRLIERTGNIETGILVDVDGDGRATDFFPDTQITCLYRLGGSRPKVDGFFSRDSVSDARCDMGRGCGDLNGDGRNDLLTPAAWYEQRADGTWKRHPLDIGFSDKARKLGHASNMIVYDVDGDGLNDILVSSAHRYGIFWCRQLKERDAAGEIRFAVNVIDDTWTQAHYLGWGDIDGDGVPELVTGKRFMAHNGGDPDEFGRLCVFYYDFTPGPNPVFRKYVVSFDSDIGVGLNVECVDMDGDGDLDLVTTGKWGGPVIFENKTK
ncbi:MAG: FG-GAP-like repeat-containing protein [Kiritimatiellia bacterium]